MVASGLTGDAIYVKPVRLALHFMFALGLLCYTFWFALQLTVSSGEKVHNQALKKFLPWILSLLFLQLIYGAFLAGHKAATAAPTWPTINQEWIPGGLFKPSDGSINWIDNLIFLHFVHRGLAYLLLLTILYYTAQLYKQQGSPRFYQARKWPAILVLLQVLLGILSVLASTKIIPGQWGIFEWIAQLHQLVAMLLLLSLVQLLFLISRKALGTT